MHVNLDLIQFIFFIIGVLAVFTVASALFFAFDKGPKKIFTNNPVPPVTSPDFIPTLSQILNDPAEKGGTVEILHNGDAFFPTLINEINKAERSINFTVYIWKKGKASDMILNALIEKQKQGVQVRVLLDGFGAVGAPYKKFWDLKKAGGKVASFRSFQLGKLTSFHRRSHRRSIVIDGKVGFTGGMSVKDVWLGNARNPSEWRDIMFKVTGPLALRLQSAFTELWTNSTGEIMFGNGIYPSEPIDKNTDLEFIHLVSSPSDAMTLAKFILLSMKAATKKLYITTPYFIPDRHVLSVLKECAQAGVDVRIMLPGKNIDNKTVRWNAQNFYYELLQCGVKIYEYQPTFNHSKYLIVDGHWSIIGSPNQNFRSRKLDEENAFGILNVKLAQELEQTFNTDVKNCKEITLKNWKKRSTFVKLLAIVSRVLEEQS